jgi:hypothetical protein
MSREGVLEGEEMFSLCLPGIADDGYIQFFSKFFNSANGVRIGIIFGAISKDDRIDFAEKTKAIHKYMVDSHLAKELANTVHKRYKIRPYINSSNLLKNVENKAGIKLIVIKDERYKQISINNFPAFAKLQVHKEQIKKLAEVFQKAENAYVQINEEESIALLRDSYKIVIVIAKGTIKDKRLIMVCCEVIKKIKRNENKYFITNYY